MKADKIRRLEKIPEAYVDLFADFGPSYFNPAFGIDDAETLANIAELAGFLCSVLGNESIEHEHPRAVEMVARLIWTAAQASTHANNPEEGEKHEP